MRSNPNSFFTKVVGSLFKVRGIGSKMNLNLEIGRSEFPFETYTRCFIDIEIFFDVTI